MWNKIEIHLNGKWHLHRDLFRISSSIIRFLVSVYTSQIIVYIYAQLYIIVVGNRAVYTDNHVFQ